jgi:hypothetical protein
MGDEFDQENNFGGVFYFYIRGMNNKNNTGIYFISPDKLGPFEIIEKDLLKSRYSYISS